MFLHSALFGGNPWYSYDTLKSDRRNGRGGRGDGFVRNLVYVCECFPQDVLVSVEKARYYGCWSDWRDWLEG